MYVAQYIVLVSCYSYQACPHMQQVHARVLSCSELSQELLFPQHLATTNTHTTNTAFAQCQYKNPQNQGIWAIYYNSLPRSQAIFGDRIP